MSNEKFKVKFGLAVGDTVATIDGTTGNIVTDGDIQIKGNDIISSTGATAITLSGSDITTGDITLNGGDIRSSGGTIAISVSGADVEIAGDVTVNGNDIKSNGGTTAITLNGADVTVPGNLAVNGGFITTTAGTARVFNSIATTVNIAGAATAVNIGANTGTTTVNNDLVADSITTSGDAAINGGDITTSSTSATVFDATATTINAFGAGTIVNIGNAAASQTISIGNASTANSGYNIGTGVTASGSTKTVNIGTGGASGSFTNVNIGSSTSGATGTTTINNNLAVDSGVITTNKATASIFNSTPTTVNIAGAATTVSIGANTGTTTINNSLVADDLSVTGGVTANGVTVGATANQVSTTSSNLTLNTANGTNSGSIVITAGANGNITLTPNGTGDVILSADTVQVGDANATATVTTNGTGDLVLNTNNGTNAGNITLSNGTNGNITVTPNGTGNFALSASNGGNLTNTRNYVFGAIRDATTQANGDMWSFSSGTGTGYRGVSVDNSVATTKRPAYLVRTYGGGLSGGAPRSAYLNESSRGTAASPTALQQFDSLGEFIASGRTSTGWLSDLINATPAAHNFYTAENWVSTTNVGSGWLLRLQPTATTLTAAGASLISVIDASPQQYAQRADSWAVSAGKTVSFNASGCSVSGTTLTIGTLVSGSIAVGTAVQSTTGAFTSTYITANISGSGSGSTWTLSQSQTTASGLTVIGYKGAIGYAPAIATLDMLQPIKLYNGTITSRDNTYTLNNNAGTNMITMAANGQFYVYDPANTTGNYLKLDNPTSNTADDNMTLTLALNNSNGVSAASEFPIFNFTNYRYNSGGSVFVPTQNGDALGGFKFNGQYSSTGTSSIGMPTQVQALATENWTSTAQGTKINFTVNKKGTASGLATISAASDQTTFQSDAFYFNDSSGTGVVSGKIDYNRVFGQWQYDATITPAAANTAYAFPFQGTNAVTDYANIASAVNTSQILPGAIGYFNLQFSIQLENTSGSADHVAYIWWRKNGTDIPGSMGRVYVTKGNSTISAWNNLVQTTATTDYFELMYAVDNTALVFPYYASTAFGPATAAAFLSIVPVGA